MSGPLYHLVAASLWHEAVHRAQPYWPPTYTQDGFIHLTADPKFLLKVGNLFYKTSEHRDWLLLVLDPSKLSSKVVYEPAAPVGDKPSTGLADDGSTKPSEQLLFPHLYGTIDYGAVTRTLEIVRAEDGTFLDIPGLTT